MADTDDDGFAEKLAHWRRHGFGVLRPGYRSATRTEPVRHDHTGEPVGTRTEHWSGRVDATARKVEVIPNPNLTAGLRQGDTQP